VTGRQQEIVLRAVEEENSCSPDSATIQSQPMVELIVPQLVLTARSENATFSHAQLMEGFQSGQCLAIAASPVA